MNFLKFCCGSVEVVEQKIGFSTQMVADSCSAFHLLSLTRHLHRVDELRESLLEPLNQIEL
jgi:hypothetical protein